MRVSFDNLSNECSFLTSISFRDKSYEHFAESKVCSLGNEFVINTNDELSLRNVNLIFTEDELRQIKDIVQPALFNGPLTVEKKTNMRNSDVNTLFVNFHEFDNQPILVPNTFKLDLDILEESIDNGYEVLYLGDYMVWRNSAFIVIQDLQGENNPIVIHRNTFVNALTTIIAGYDLNLLSLSVLVVQEVTFSLPPIKNVTSLGKALMYWGNSTIYVLSNKVANILSNTSPQTSAMMSLESILNTDKIVDVKVNIDDTFSISTYSNNHMVLLMPPEVTETVSIGDRLTLLKTPKDSLQPAISSGSITGAVGGSIGKSNIFS